MLSRRHIRIKVMQALYIHWVSGNGNSTKVLEKNMLNSLQKLYELYLYLLLFLEETGHFVSRYEDETRARYIPKSEEYSNLSLYSNRVLRKLMENENFHNTLSKYNVVWQAENDLVRKIFFDLKNTDAYTGYVRKEPKELIDDLEILQFIIKHYSANHSLFLSHFEEMFYNWHDDRKVALNMTLKTLSSIAEDPENEVLIMPISEEWEENSAYAVELLGKTIEHSDELQKLVNSKISKWEPGQVAHIDSIILKMAICEFLYFPSIPTKVTINEYIELSKNYSSPKSKNFINGVLDSLLKDLQNEGRIQKTGRGLFNK